MSDVSNKSRQITYFEDISVGASRTYGPLVFPLKLMELLLDAMNEKHPLHADLEFAKMIGRSDRVVPGGFIHSITSGWIISQGHAAAIIGMRSNSWEYLRPLYPDRPFYFFNKVLSQEIVDDRRGIIQTFRKVYWPEGNTIAIGRMSALIMRRP